MIVGFQGVKGTQTESAILKLQQHEAIRKQVETVAFPTQEALCDALISGKISHAMVTAESSCTGTIQNTLLDLIEHAKSGKPLHIVGEYVHVEPHLLLGLNDKVQLADIKEIRSHPDVLEQCKSWLDNTFGNNVRRVSVNGTGWAAKDVQDLNDGSIAAIAGVDAKNLYQLQVLAKDLEYPLQSFTKYWLISSEPAHPERHLEPRTCISLRVINRPGTLFKVLASFALRDINVYKIESLANQKSIQQAHTPWEYILLLECEGAPEIDNKLANALSNIREFAIELFVLGSYPRYMFRDGPVGYLPLSM